MPEIEGSALNLQPKSSRQILNHRFPFDFHGGVAKEKTIPSKQVHGTEVREVEFREGSFKQGHEEAMSSHILPPLPGTPDKRQRKPKVSKRKGFLPENPESVDGSSTIANGCRYDSSLGLLTKKFLSLLQQAEDGTLDLNRAADVLDVQKRRIYDITNVLEGVGLIEKKLKNMIRWKGTDTSRPKELNDQLSGLKDEVQTLYSDESRIDEVIREMQESLRAMTEDERNRKWLFVTNEDIINTLPCFEDTLIAVRAPHGTSFEVPDPNEGLDFPQLRYRILLRSSMGPINCYLLSSKHEGKLQDLSSMKQAATMDHPLETNCNHITDQTPSLHSLNQNTMTTAYKSRSSKANNEVSLESFSSRDSLGSIVKIVPSDVDMDVDYFLSSDPGVSITDTWMAE
ncbi:transcription factor E2FB-like isoform X1 [Iris pallida]|uniref:Transcription factor E2FB-like isoform X1 n=1 Tax=Iris pallida TaxID=29817 RepID=A0AAX6HHG7_IRIPA|nr:transcription factor E2FB-like isoform X1 [Iris pallida]